MVTMWSSLKGRRKLFGELSGNIQNVLGTFRGLFPEHSEDIPTGVKEVT